MGVALSPRLYPLLQRPEPANVLYPSASTLDVDHLTPLCPIGKGEPQAA